MTHESKSATGAAIGSLKLGLDTLAGFTGFAMFAASFLGLFAIAPELVAPSHETLLMRVALALALSLAFLVISALSHVLAVRKCRALVAAAVLGLAAAAVAMLVPIGSFQVLLAVSCLAAGGLGALASLWFCFVCARPHRIIPLFIAAGIGGGVAVCLAEGYLVAGASRTAVVLVWTLSVTCAIALMRSRPETVVPVPVGNRESDRRSKILWTSALMLSISNFEFGFLLGTASDIAEKALCLAVASVVAVLLVVNFAGKGVVNERSISPIVPPLTMLAFLSLYLFGDSVRLAALGILAALFTVYTVFGMAAIAEHVRLSRLSATRAYAKARFLDYLGLALGLVCGFALAELAVSDSVQAMRLSAIIALAYGFVAAFCHKARFPETGMENEGERAMPETKGLWKKRCRMVSEQCDLSERQYEVLVLVSQGRNAKYIEQALSISLSTAQTHIRNIYRKTGVHSRQELLNLIEDTKLYGEE